MKYDVINTVGQETNMLPLYYTIHDLHNGFSWDCNLYLIIFVSKRIDQFVSFTTAVRTEFYKDPFKSQR